MPAAGSLIRVRVTFTGESSGPATAPRNRNPSASTNTSAPVGGSPMSGKRPWASVVIFPGLAGPPGNEAQAVAPATGRPDRSRTKPSRVETWTRRSGRILSARSGNARSAARAQGVWPGTKSSASAIAAYSPSASSPRGVSKRPSASVRRT